MLSHLFIFSFLLPPFIFASILLAACFSFIPPLVFHSPLSDKEKTMYSTLEVITSSRTHAFVHTQTHEHKKLFYAAISLFRNVI